jgi:hypothetical protein
MNLLTKIILWAIGIVVLDTILLNVFHLADYLITAISVGIVVLVALYEFQKRK